MKAWGRGLGGGYFLKLSNLKLARRDFRILKAWAVGVAVGVAVVVCLQPMLRSQLQHKTIIASAYANITQNGEREKE